jgi:glucokinase
MRSRISSGGGMTDGDPKSPALIGDVGGTNCRLALTEAGPGGKTAISQVRTYPADDYATFEDAVGTYLGEVGARASAAVIAVAGPVSDGAVAMTNHAWHITERGLAAKIGAPARLINDFEALAHALPALGAGDVLPLGQTPAPSGKSTMAVMGAGTGFGTAALVRNATSHAVLVAEGGHSAFAPSDELELEIWKRLAARFSGYVQVEHLLSGPGLVNLHRALCDIEARPVNFETPDQITDAVEAGDPRALAVADRFVRIFGATAADLALAQGARGGVYIAGGVSARLLAAKTAATFRARFEAKGEFSPYLIAIPTQLITHDQPGLLGAACALAGRDGN